jgi:hypothetical protein
LLKEQDFADLLRRECCEEVPSPNTSGFLFKSLRD